MHIFHFNASSFVSQPYAGFITIAHCGKRVAMRDTVSAHNPIAATCDACWREYNARATEKK